MKCPFNGHRLGDTITVSPNFYDWFKRNVNKNAVTLRGRDAYFLFVYKNDV